MQEKSARNYPWVIGSASDQNRKASAGKTKWALIFIFVGVMLPSIAILAPVLTQSEVPSPAPQSSSPPQAGQGPVPAKEAKVNTVSFLDAPKGRENDSKNKAKKGKGRLEKGKSNKGEKKGWKKGQEW